MASSFVAQADKREWPDSVNGTRQLYDDWANTYDSELKQHGYNAPEAVVKAVVKWVHNKKARLMDIACGTGLVGEELVKAGYSSIDGLDMSTESIKICEDKNIYGRIICSKVGSEKKLDIDNANYDATLCVGCFGPNHMNEESFPELTRITKHGGFLVIIVRECYFNKGEEFNYKGKFDAAIQTLVQQGKWELVERNNVEGYYGSSTGILLVFKIL